jgi:hypothetical protein
MSEVTYYVALPFVASDDGAAPGEAAECPSANAAVMHAEALSRKPGHTGALAFSRTGDPSTGDFGESVSSATFRMTRANCESWETRLVRRDHADARGYPRPGARDPDAAAGRRLSASAELLLSRIRAKLEDCAARCCAKRSGRSLSRAIRRHHAAFAPGSDSAVSIARI